MLKSTTLDTNMSMGIIVREITSSQFI